MFEKFMCCVGWWCGLLGGGGVIGVGGVIEHVESIVGRVFRDPVGARGGRGYCGWGCRLLGKSC